MHAMGGAWQHAQQHRGSSQYCNKGTCPENSQQLSNSCVCEAGFIKDYSTKVLKCLHWKTTLVDSGNAYTLKLPATLGRKLFALIREQMVQQNPAIVTALCMKAAEPAIDSCEEMLFRVHESSCISIHPDHTGGLMDPTNFPTISFRFASNSSHDASITLKPENYLNWSPSSMHSPSLFNVVKGGGIQKDIAAPQAHVLCHTLGVNNKDSGENVIGAGHWTIHSSLKSPARSVSPFDPYGKFPKSGFWHSFMGVPDSLTVTGHCESKFNAIYKLQPTLISDRPYWASSGASARFLFAIDCTGSGIRWMLGTTPNCDHISYAESKLLSTSAVPPVHHDWWLACYEKKKWQWITHPLKISGPVPLVLYVENEL